MTHATQPILCACSALYDAVASNMTAASLEPAPPSSSAEEAPVFSPKTSERLAVVLFQQRWQGQRTAGCIHAS